MPRWLHSAYPSKVFARRFVTDRNSSFALGATREASIFLPAIPGVDFDGAWERRVESVVDDDRPA